MHFHMRFNIGDGSAQEKSITGFTPVLSAWDRAQESMIHMKIPLSGGDGSTDPRACEHARPSLCHQAASAAAHTEF